MEMLTELERQSETAVRRVRALVWAVVEELLAEGHRPEQVTLVELKQRLARRIREQRGVYGIGRQSA